MIKCLLLTILCCCSQPATAQIFCNLTQVGGPAGPGLDCAFPFIFYGRSYDSCTNVGDGDLRPWCPTQLNPAGEYKFGSNHWSYCDPACPFIDAGGHLQEGTTPKPSLRKDRPVIVQPSQPTNNGPALVFKPPTRRPKVTTTLDPLSFAAANPSTHSGTWLPRVEEGVCGFSVSVGYILGGTQAARGDFPYIALLGYRGTKGRKRDYKCGGTLINRRYVLTAAHCHEAGVRGQEILEVVLGEFDVSTDPDCEGCRKAQRIVPEEIVLHQNYEATRRVSGEHDIALVRLSTPAVTILEDIESVVLPVCLDFDLPLDLVKDSLHVAGWGKTTNTPLEALEDFNELGVSERTLQRLKVPLVENPRCKTYWTKLTDNHICAGGEQGHDSCQGDSGGPLVASRFESFFLMGIVSSGTKDCGTGRAGLYTRVSSYKDWILSNLRE